MELRALVGAARAGEGPAFTELVRRHQDMAFGYAFAILRDFHLAQDAVQQAFVAAYFGLDRLREPEQFPAWLRGIVRHQCLRLLRGRRVETVPLDRAGGVAATEPGPERRAEEREALDRVLAAIDALPTGQREAAALFYLGDYAQREVAAFLDLPVTTVNNRLHAARKRLTAELRGGVLPMARDTLKQNGLPDDFAEGVGRIVRARGPVVEARFAPEAVPPVLTVLTVGGAGGEAGIAVQVAQHLGDGVVRGIALSGAGQAGLAAGTAIVDTGQPVDRAVDREQVAAIVAVLGGAAPAGEPAILTTGLKAIDLFCPCAANGTIGLAGDMGAGKIVLVDELARNLADARAGVAFFNFVQPGAEVALLRATFPPGYDFTRSVIVPIDDPRALAAGQAPAALDTVLYLSRDLSTAGFFPAVDPLRSSSRFLDPALVGREHYDVAQAARRLLRQAAETEDGAIVARAERLRRFLTQPMFVAEPWTGRPGQFVSRERTVADCRAILSGAYDGLPEEAFLLRGTREEVVEGAGGRGGN